MIGPVARAGSMSGSSGPPGPPGVVVTGPTKWWLTDAPELVARVEEKIPSIYPWHNPDDEGKPFPFTYTCIVHEVSGRSQTARPRICWYGGEDLFMAPSRKQQSEARGWPRT